MLLKGKAHRQLVRLQGFVEFSKGGRVSAIPSVVQPMPPAMRRLRLGPDEIGRDFLEKKSLAGFEAGLPPRSGA